MGPVGRLQLRRVEGDVRAWASGGAAAVEGDLGMVDPGSSGDGAWEGEVDGEVWPGGGEGLGLDGLAVVEAVAWTSSAFWDRPMAAQCR